MTLVEREKLLLELLPMVRGIAHSISSIKPYFIEYDDLISVGVIGLMDAVSRHDPDKSSIRHYAWIRARGAMIDYIRSQLPLTKNQIKKGETVDVITKAIQREQGVEFISEEDPFLKKNIIELIEGLSENERLVVSLHYFSEMDLSKVAEILEFNACHISQIHKKALSTMKKRIKNKEGFPIRKKPLSGKVS